MAVVLVAIASSALVAWLNPGLVRFWPFTVPDFVQLVTPIVLVALFIERVLEVFLTSWRAQEARQLSTAAKAAQHAATEPGVVPEVNKQLIAYRSRTQRIAFFWGTGIGIVVAALGVRVLELFLDPAIFTSLPQGQQRLFRVADVLLTGALLGGGADVLHQLMSVFTSYMESAARLAKGRGEG
jgi:hypothetical protein